MLFNSFSFLLFFVIVTTLYYIIPYKPRLFLLLGASCFFYMLFVPEYIIILFVTILIDYIAGIYIEKHQNHKKKKKLYLIISILATCLVLFIFKYYNFFIENFLIASHKIGFEPNIKIINMILPIGLSFHTFQSLSYVIEVYRGNQKTEKNFLIYSIYVMFYPQLVAGPIERPQNIIHQFKIPHQFNKDNIVLGLRQMLWGFFMKVVIADRLSLYVDAVYNNPDNHHGLSIIIATLFFSIQIYCDFAGYSNIAIGSAKVMGFDLMKNFNRPYFSFSVSEFWSRWHISLSTWFRDYLYIPLGGSKNGKIHHLRNLLITFLISGLWHGANWTFIVWGGLNGLYLIFEIILNKNKTKNILSYAITMSLIVLSWLFFRATDLSTANTLLKNMTIIDLNIYIGDIHTLLYSLLGISILFIVEFLEERKKISTLKISSNAKIRYTYYVIIIFCILLFGVFDESQFIYFQF